MASKITKFIDYALLTILGVFCFRYILRLGRLFAETNVQFSFLNFPVFIGEFVLAACLVLFFVRVCLSKISVNKWHYWIIAYFVFVLIKAWWGYLHWGPLAFRDAALFYYAAFAVIAYYAYRSDYFNRFTILVMYAALLWMYFDSNFNDFWILGRILFGLILAYRYPQRWVGVLMVIGILVLTPYQYFMNVSRTVILGNFLALSFLALTSVFLVERKIRLKIFMAGAVLIASSGAYVFYLSNNLPAQTIFNLNKLITIFKELDGEVQLYKPYYSMIKIPYARIYNPDTVSHEGDQKVIAENLDAVQTEYQIENDRLVESKLLSVEHSSVSIRESSKTQTVVSVHTVVVEQEDQAQDDPPVPAVSDDFARGVKFGNAVFRLFIWRDLLSDLIVAKPILGFDFGKPFRSVSLEIIRSAVGEWGRDGWIAMHNSYLNILYRSGVVGLAFIFMFFYVFVYLVKTFIRLRSMVGLFLCSILIGWFIAANFALVFDIPYNAIPIWTLYGMTLAFAHQQLKKAGNKH